jgi:hypothetical protein
MPDGHDHEITQERVCVVCGCSLASHRSDALCCSASCRAERSRVSAILRGVYSGPYRSLREREEARQKRTRRRSRPFAGDLTLTADPIPAP